MRSPDGMGISYFVADAMVTGYDLAVASLYILADGFIATKYPAWSQLPSGG